MKIGTLELVVIAIVALLVIGPNKLPEYARKLGQAFLQRLDETAQRLICAEQEVTHGKD